MSRNWRRKHKIWYGQKRARNAGWAPRLGKGGDSYIEWCNKWQNTGHIDAILEALQLHLNEEGLIDFDLWCIDGSNVRASKDAAGARKKTLR